MTPLSPHFTLEELTVTLHREIDNHPTPEIVSALTDTAKWMEVVRRVLGDKVITVSSGYRSPALNAAVGGPANRKWSGKVWIRAASRMVSVRFCSGWMYQ